MRIDDSNISDTTFTSPHSLFLQLNSLAQPLDLGPTFAHPLPFSHVPTPSSPLPPHDLHSTHRLSTRHHNVTNLKRLIKQQKISNIQRKFIAKLKLNNVNSRPVEFQPYSDQQPTAIIDTHGIQLPDWLEKLFSLIIIMTIIICMFIDTTYIAFPSTISQSYIISLFQPIALIIFFLQFLSSFVIVKTVDGRKITTMRCIAKWYVENGMIVDLLYLIVLLIEVVDDVGMGRVVVVLKLAEFFERVEKIENSFINTFYKEQYWGLAKVVLINFAFSHILSILLILMSHLQPSVNWLTVCNLSTVPPFQQYIWSFYWGTTIMLTVGFGDIAPANYKQACCLVMIQTICCLALAYNINCVGNLIANIKSQDIEKNKNIKTFKILSSRNSLTEELQMKIHNYIEESTNIKKKFNFQQQSSFIHELPRELKAEFLKQSNKKIFEKVIFFKNLTERTLLNFAEVIQMKICHPEQIIKKRGEIAGVMILKQGKLGLSTKLNGSDFTNTTVQTVSVTASHPPFLLSLDFLSNERTTYDIKSQEYSILYYLDRDKTLEVLKTGELDYEHFCFLKDKSRNLQTDYEVFQCIECGANHSKFQCPKLHYCPLKKHVVDKFLWKVKMAKAKRKKFTRDKTAYNAFGELQNNLRMFGQATSVIDKYASYKHIIYKPAKQQPPKTQTLPHTQPRILGSCSQTLRDIVHNFQGQLQTEKRIECQYVAGYLKDEIQKIISNQSEVWLVETDEVKNFKFYFIAYNAGTLEYLNRKQAPNVGR